MSARRGVRRVAASILAIGTGVLVAVPTAAGADTPYQAAWWNRLQLTAPGAQATIVPPPPNVPDGGLYVAGTASSPTAFAALRYAVDGAVGGTLTLHVAAGSAAGAVVDACAVTMSWSGGGNQDFGAAPTYDCAQKATGVVDATGSTITWEIPATLYRADAYAVDIALLPGGAAASQVAFARPDDASFAHAPVEAVVDGGAVGDTGDAALSPDVVAPSSDPFVAYESPRPAFDLAAPAATPTGAAPGAAVSPPATRSPTAGGAPATGLPTAPASLLRPGDSRGERIGAVLGLLLVAAVLWWFGGVPARAPRLLGGAAGAGGGADAPAEEPGPVRGIGRFARPRSGRVPRP